ncbi:MAG: hypothetical protein K2X49_05890 [Acetobacteraceae bacterium]|nr:hypothetical protein [Acetobacteraceae bacterium]
MELRIILDDDYMRALQQGLGAARATEVVRESLTLLNWAMTERQRGRVILSATPEGQSVTQLAMPALERVGAARD